MIVGNQDLPKQSRHLQLQHERSLSRPIGINYSGGNAMREIRPIVALALRAVAVAMATASIAFIALKIASIELHVVLLAVGLFALCIASIVMEPKV